MIPPRGALVGFLQPAIWAEALDVRAGHPGGVPGAGRGRRGRHVEGLAPLGHAGPVHEAFVQAGAIQCGFCTPGLVMAAHDLFCRVSDPSDDQIREAPAGNLCRCADYRKIIDAAHLAAGRANARRGF